MIETRRLKNVAIFLQTVLSFVLSRKTHVFFLKFSFRGNPFLFEKFVGIDVDDIFTDIN